MAVGVPYLDAFMTSRRPFAISVTPHAALPICMCMCMTFALLREADGGMEAFATAT
jgi:hypothetical protein